MSCLSSLHLDIPEVGRPVTADMQPPTSEKVAAFAAKSAEFGFKLATVEENASYGIELPVFSG